MQQRQRTNIWISVKACESSPVPCPHPSTLTCVSLTMETFSLRVRGGTLLWKKKHLTASFIMPLLESHFSTHYFVSYSLMTGGRQTEKTTGKLTRVHEASHLQCLLKIPPSLQRVLCKHVLAQQNKAGHLKSAPSPSLQEIFKSS